ncbi:MAG: crossover junction endodeoxyribonuclease RuvC [Patescibacteria group bacterium]
MPNSKNSFLILGIDPGYAITGYGIVRHDRQKVAAVAQGAIMSKPAVPYEERLKKIFVGLTQLIKKYRPDAMAIEKLFFAANTATVMRVGEARGVAILAAGIAGIPVREFTPLQIKQAITGDGRADKLQMQRMVKVLLKLPAVPRPDDVADALAVGICGGIKNF